MDKVHWEAPSFPFESVLIFAGEEEAFRADRLGESRFDALLPWPVAACSERPLSKCPSFLVPRGEALEPA